MAMEIDYTLAPCCRCGRHPVVHMRVQYYIECTDHCTWVENNFIHFSLAEGATKEQAGSFWNSNQTQLRHTTELRRFSVLRQRREQQWKRIEQKFG